jgi:hypothetical protein
MLLNVVWQIAGHESTIMIEKIISGGQTGADRAALDFAIYHDIPHGGWCPKGRLAEDGIIECRYHLQETSTKNYPQRTEKNVQESDGTVIFALTSKLAGGSKKTAELAAKHGKPWIHLPGGFHDAPLQLLNFIAGHRVKTLNVAGSRASKDPQIYEFVKQTLEEAFFPRPSSWIGGPGEG